ncbi:hypothetical protein TNIN_168791 [Trichonephila inaurata madagascariensis]|uniref:Secreted protein n=1 Tax=Trichonephila inaurata madagascariensis TaxID=2747483 RepID=A0A8X6M8S8_9ARAC|nr:hypothetical protein TNIN_168791 [Trichonephila inaurata madagascariensis]
MYTLPPPWCDLFVFLIFNSKLCDCLVESLKTDSDPPFTPPTAVAIFSAGKALFNDVTATSLTVSKFSVELFFFLRISDNNQTLRIDKA